MKFEIYQNGGNQRWFPKKSEIYSKDGKEPPLPFSILFYNSNGIGNQTLNFKGNCKEEIKEPFSNCWYKHFIMKLKSIGNPQFKLTNKKPSSNLHTVWYQYQKKEKAQSKGKPIQEAKKRKMHLLSLPQDYRWWQG